MGFSGQLGTVNLADIFQTLHMNRQTGTMTVSGLSEVVRIWFSEGQVVLCTAPQVEGRAFIVHAVLKKGLLQSEVSDEIGRRNRQTGQSLRELLLHTGLVPEHDLDEVAAWCIEEQVCPTFEWSQGEFSFEEGDPPADLQSSDIVQMGPGGMQTTALVMEATRRKDEWRRIREVINDPEALYLVDNDGRANLRNLQTDPEILKVLRYLDGRHTLESIAQGVGLTRFDTYAIVAQLVLGGVARVRGPAEVVEDALALKAQGEPAKARELLENAARSAPVPEVLLPLAQVCAELNQVPRAVELYLTLIQQSQDAGDLKQALSHLDTVIGLSPDDPDLQFERAQVHAELGNVEPGAQGFVAAAQAYLATKDVAKAVDACHRAKNLLPRSPDPHRYLARAYLLDGNTETAVVEYKSLWHALLTLHRPRRALEELNQILDSDCKYAAVKEQVLSHAQNSEAVKTSKAVRALVYVAMCCVLVAAGVAGWIFWQRHLLRGRGIEEIARFEATLPAREDAIEHPQLKEDIGRMKQRYAGGVAELEAKLNALDNDVTADFERRADIRLSLSETLRKAGKFGESYTVLNDLKTRYAGTRAATGAEVARTRIRSEEIGTEILARAEQARARWKALEWDQALAELKPVLARPDLPGDIRKDLTQDQVKWEAALRSAKALGERAAAIEASGDQLGALVAWRRAADPAADGDGDRATAANRLVALERSLAADLERLAKGAAARGDAVATFSAIDRLQALAKDARGTGPKEVLGALAIPFTIELDSRQVVIALQRPGKPVEVVRAPPGTTGSWRHVVAWAVTETVNVAVARTGFAQQNFAITAAARRVAAQVVLVRGPRWRADLGSIPVAPPWASPAGVLMGTNRATLEVIDPQQGVSRPVGFSDTVAELSAQPVLFNGRAYVVIDDRIHAVDLAGRARVWTWPASGGPAERQHLLGAMAVQEHELIQGQILVIAAAARGDILVLAVDPAGRITTYPSLHLPTEVSGQLVTDHDDPSRSILYVPAGAALAAYDLTAVTESNPPQGLFTVRTRGDLLGIPRKVTIAGVRSLLLADNSGLLVAIDKRVATPDAKRIVASWPLDGTGPSTPVVSDDGASAWVTLTEGRVQCVDLTKPGQTRWRAPAKGVGFGALVGAPALGRRGLYVVDANGMIHCLDPQTGAERWKADLGGTPAGGPLALDGRVLVGVKNGQAVCFEEGEE